MLFKKGFILFFLFGFPIIFSAQQVSHWGENEGLSHRRINHAIQDKDGFIWIATVNGLNRFNGYNFLVYDKSNLKELGSNEINYLLQDSKGDLWIGTQNGLHVMNLANHRIVKSFKNNSSKASLSNNNVLCIAETDSHEIVVTTANGWIQKYIGDSSFVVQKNSSAVDGSFGKVPMLLTNKNKIYLNTFDEGCYELEAKNLSVLKNFGGKTEYFNGSINYIPALGLVVSNNKGAQVIDTIDNQLKPLFNQLNKDVHFTLRDYKNEFWLVANERKHLFRISNNELNDVSNSLFDFSENVHISFLLEDSSHNLWICTNNGIYKLSNEKILFTSILRKDQFKKANYIPSFRGMLEDSAGTLFIGGYGGLFKLDTNKIITQLFDNKIALSPYTLIDKNKNELYVVSEGFGILNVNKNSGKVDYLTESIPRKDGIGDQYFMSAVVANDGNFIIGGTEGLFKFNPKTKELFPFHLAFKDYSFSNSLVRRIYKDAKENIWFCTSNGVFVCNNDLRPIEHYDKDEKGKFYIPYSGIKCVLQDHNKNIWLGTENKGLIILNDSGYKLISTKDHLADNSISSILEDNTGSVWVATNNGLSQINSNGKIFNYFTEQGLSNNEFNGGSFLKTKKGMLFFGGVNGVNICNPMIEQNKNNQSSSLILSKAEIPINQTETKTYFNDSEIKNGIELSHNLGYLYFEFFVNDYLRTNKNSFEYILEGYNKRWVSLGEQNSLRFAGISSGDYLLRIKASNSRGDAIKNEIVIPISIKQIFYKTWWFIALSFTLILGVISIFVYMQFKRLKVVSEMRIKIASDLHDDIGSVLTKIAMQTEVLEEDALPQNKNTLQSIAISCRNAMNNMRDMVWSIDARNAKIGNLFDKMTDHAHHMFESGKFDCTFNLDSSIKNISLSPIQKQEIFYIYKEAINNILKYSNGNKVAITIFKKEKHCVVMINDNGILSETKNIAGSGMNNMEMRAKRLKGKINFTSQKGFTVTLAFPINRTLNIF